MDMKDLADEIACGENHVLVNNINTNMLIVMFTTVLLCFL